MLDPFKGNDAFQRDSRAGKHIRTKIVTLKEPLRSGQQVHTATRRPTALGKKNWLFFGDANAGERSAVICSIIESCRRHGVEPYSYLRDVLTRLPSMTN
jgi:hypothetical protein